MVGIYEVMMVKLREVMPYSILILAFCHVILFTPAFDIEHLSIYPRS
jgi:hypothetical protein